MPSILQEEQQRFEEIKRLQDQVTRSEFLTKADEYNKHLENRIQQSQRELEDLRLQMFKPKRTKPVPRSPPKPIPSLTILSPTIIRTVFRDADANTVSLFTSPTSQRIEPLLPLTPGTGAMSPDQNMENEISDIDVREIERRLLEEPDDIDMDDDGALVIDADDDLW